MWSIYAGFTVDRKKVKKTNESVELYYTFIEKIPTSSHRVIHFFSILSQFFNAPHFHSPWQFISFRSKRSLQLYKGSKIDENGKLHYEVTSNIL